MKILEKEGKSLISRQRKGIHSFYQKVISTAVITSTNDRSVRQFPGSTPPCVQDFCHELSFINEKIDSLDKIINQSIRQDNPNEYVSSENPNL